MADQIGILNCVAVEQRTELIWRNVRWLRQAHNLLLNIDDETYGACCSHTQLLSVSRHVQWLIDLYERFLAGLGYGRIDYDNPNEKTPEILSTRSATITRILSIILRLKSCAELSADATLGSGPGAPGDGTSWNRS